MGRSDNKQEDENMFDTFNVMPGSVVCAVTSSDEGEMEWIDINLPKGGAPWQTGANLSNLIRFWR